MTAHMPPGVFAMLSCQSLIILMPLQTSYFFCIPPAYISPLHTSNFFFIPPESHPGAGLPTDLLTRWPALKAFRNSIATIPEVTAYYFNATDEPRKIGYRPDA